MTYILDPGNKPNSYSDAARRDWQVTAGLWKGGAQDTTGSVNGVATPGWASGQLWSTTASQWQSAYNTQLTNYNNEVTAFNNEVTAYNNGHILTRNLGVNASSILVGNGGATGYLVFADGTNSYTAPATGTYFCIASAGTESEVGSGSFRTRVEIGGVNVTDDLRTIENNGAPLTWAWTGSVSAGQTIRFAMVNSTGGSKHLGLALGSNMAWVGYAAAAN